MRFILSPSKRQVSTGEISISPRTKPLFLSEATRISKAVQKLSKKKLQSALALSDKLGESVFQTWSEWSDQEEGAIAAIELFQGDVYDGLNFSSMSSEEKLVASESGWIMSALYGILNGSDGVQPYRLDLKDDVKIQGKSLLSFWKLKLESTFPNWESEEIVFDLTSTEYYALLPKHIKQNSVRIDFKEEVNGRLKSVSFFAKKARGLFARYAVQNAQADLGSFKDFNEEGYRFNEAESSEHLWIFSRKSQ